MEEQQTSHNTLENRFLKYTLGIIEKHYRSLADRILSDSAYQIADSEKEHIRRTRDELQHLMRNPFFRTIGKFEGLKQESLVLQRDVNYSNVFRTYIILRKSFNLNDGLYRMETKNIATLYEIWCFIQVEKVVKELFGDSVSVEHPSRPEMNGLFTRDLKWGEQSKIVFKQGDITLAELFYNPQHGDSVNGLKGIQGLRTYTVPQRPDIVLQLTKDDLQRGMQMTYLFDAKYRVEVAPNGVEMPPQDTINQMHRYRDAIYYKHAEGEPKKEVLGGYILFPGNMSDSDKYRRSVDEVNIGAFPMQPGDQAHVKPSARAGYYEAFENSNADLYYTGVQFPTTVSLHDLHFFMPYIKNKGIRDVYEVIKVRTTTSKEAHQVPTDPDNDMRIAFQLKFHHRLYSDFRRIDLTQMKGHTFIDTTFGEIDSLLID